MKNFTWFIAIVFAYIAGYFSHSGAEKAYAPLAQANSTATVVAPIATPPSANRANEQGTPAPAQPAIAQSPKNNAQPLPKSDTPIVNSTSGAHAETPTKDELAARFPKDITDAEIDKAIPAPFNDALKSSHGGVREKYRDFVAATQPQSWDSNIQNKISDYILSSPYAKFITLDSLLCKANLCEIRLYESKSHVWSLMMAEMSLQDWWDIGAYGSQGFATQLNSQNTTGYHVLLARK